MNPHMYTQFFVLGLIFAFGDAYGIGANDVANSFATSVSSGALTLGQACCIAIVTEFCGAFFLGSKTSDTIRNKIISVNLFKGNPALLMLGMFTALVSSSLFVIFATSRGWPVSTTHSITGAIIGVGIAAFGPNTVVWGWSGVAKIIASWFLSPVVSGVVASALFLLTRFFVLEAKDSFKRGLYAVPFFFFLTIWIDVAFILNNGIPGAKKKIPFTKTLWIGAIAGAGAALLSFVFYSTWLRRRIIGKEDLKWYHVFVAPILPKQPLVVERPIETSSDKVSSEGHLPLTSSDVDVQPADQSMFGKAKNFLMKGINKDVRNLNNPKLADIHARAKKFDDNTESLFQFVQVLSACAASFAHGSNDVANAVGPLTTIYQVWDSGAIPGAKASVTPWILAYCAVAIDIGLITYGYHIMRSLGNNITWTTPSRGFCAELGTSLTVVTASKIGLPVSTTQCITGAMVGVGLCNGDFRAVNWKMFGTCFLSWIITVPCTAVVSGLIFAFIAYAPKMI
ncbi:hypothetical protein BB560_001978 [Smittium megazygosporum]|uniref:Phosphate transporter n=1 Tax=Smittium megazygosporum TaxID=133381 RepID=A0A2T9ZG20_9FUNG|nr:hypothetical protein BB560_001978 [Smittium megazygosporum]